jgi:hypothetical protein
MNWNHPYIMTKQAGIRSVLQNFVGMPALGAAAGAFYGVPAGAIYTLAEAALKEQSLRDAEWGRNLGYGALIGGAAGGLTGLGAGIYTQATSKARAAEAAAAKREEYRVFAKQVRDDINAAYGKVIV